MAVHAEAGKMTVAVTGAGGRTGKLVFEKLLAQADTFVPRAVVRSEKSAPAGAPQGSVFVADISLGLTPQLEKALTGADAVVIATSAVPQIKPLSMIAVMVKKLFRQPTGMPEFGWKEGQTPEQVDWLGQKAQIDAAKAAGVQRVVLVSSMGGTQPDNNLNKIGDGNILLWKRQAEQYLIESGLGYTIIHPGGLIDQPGGERQLVVDVDDKLLERKVRSIPRADVAALAVACLTLPQALNRSFDVISLAPEEGSPTTDFAALLTAMTHNCDYGLPGKEVMEKVMA